MKRPRMTCIIGGKCSDGVVLIADRKVIDEKTNQVEYIEKLFIFKKEGFFYPIVIGSSGTVALYDKFKRAAIEKLEGTNTASFDPKNYNSNYETSISGTIYTGLPTNNTSRGINLYTYLENLESIIKDYKKEYRDQIFDVIFAAQIKERGAVIHYIREDGLIDDIYDYKTIGSGEKIASVFLKGIYEKDMNMNKFAKLGFFIIKYIEQKGLDNNVGVGKEEPQIYFIPDKGHLIEADNNFLTECEITKNIMEQNFKKILPL